MKRTNNFKNNQYYRSLLIKYGVKRSAARIDKIYWPLLDQLKLDGLYLNLSGYDELHNAILSLRK